MTILNKIIEQKNQNFQGYLPMHQAFQVLQKCALPYTKHYAVRTRYKSFLK